MNCACVRQAKSNLSVYMQGCVMVVTLELMLLIVDSPTSSLHPPPASLYNACEYARVGGSAELRPVSRRPTISYVIFTSLGLACEIGLRPSKDRVEYLTCTTE
jgi:hypothetical protein